MHRTRAQITQTNDQQVDDAFEEVKLVTMRLHRSDQTHAELFRQLRARL